MRNDERGRARLTWRCCVTPSGDRLRAYHARPIAPTSFLSSADYFYGVNPTNDSDLAAPAAFTLPVISLVIITILNDGTMITISHDKVIPERRPQRWAMFEVSVISLVLGLVACLSSMIMLVSSLASGGDARPWESGSAAAPRVCHFLSPNLYPSSPKTRLSLSPVPLTSDPNHLPSQVGILHVNKRNPGGFLGAALGSEDRDFVRWSEAQTMIYLKVRKQEARRVVTRLLRRDE